ncbi:MAG: RNA polymerase Rpb4 family protein [Methanothrix sp.]|jgi:DNA-directed RNA polymerase subunit F|uniref:DNA-directed RNA polymerase subunit Rpo4 n=1 Tax=Methanothrix thermoacetophila (strain DSM 6194 / JCM 14653 / NBRC 101360 / PT) TaxID=349307 RepID=A0B7V5_METTP|nr:MULTISPECIES: RNA polymerase Rpb4 family protein [Methanothrix]ABK14779.1 DNA-directed RNA polymerase, subunit F [Methanothrix thermoacetophila PT]MBC7080389.1 RNA polymerase Rpb4 family protein [Methanothrix sp.]NPU86944.1 RNA polymerase Rpb4 family protein [Methanothrix sp.]
MIVKNVLKDELLTIAEVNALLKEIRERRSGEAEELGYELRRAMRHAELFSHSTPEESRQLVEALLALEKVTPEIAVKIADLRPMTRDELRAIYAKEKFSLTEEELDAILDIVRRG